MADIQITIIDREDKPHDCMAPTDMGLNLMELTKACELPVTGTCGGMGICSSCHVYVLSDHELPERSETEEDTLDTAISVDEKKSRLSCQLQLRDELQGLVVQLAPEG